MRIANWGYPRGLRFARDQHGHAQRRSHWSKRDWTEVSAAANRRSDEGTSSFVYGGFNLIVVLIATAWGNSEGGINAFNYSLAIGLAQTGRDLQVYCAIPEASEQEIADAARFGVEIIPVSRGEERRPTARCPAEILVWLSGKGQNKPDLWIGHDVITGFQALAGSKQSGHAALVHHMAYIEYQNAAGGNGGKTLDKHNEQRQLLSAEGAIVFGVGPALAASALSLGAENAASLIPGFPTSFTKNIATAQRLKVVVAGRFEEKTEALKQSNLAAAALAKAVADANGDIPSLDNPTMILFGASSEWIETKEYEELAKTIAGRRLNIVPVPFNSEPGRLIGEMSSSNLVIMPSFHEGFGLVGWEAIGCEVPLILGRDAGLFKFVEELLGGSGEGCLNGIEIRGGALNQRDVEVMSQRIRRVARDLDRARRDASRLRGQLIAAKGCTWRHTSVFLLQEAARYGVLVPRHLLEVESGAVASDHRESPPPAARAVPTENNHFDRCAELEVSTAQGSTQNHYDVIAELRFGVTPLRVDDLAAEIFVRSATLRVIPEGGRLRGQRFGDALTPMPGVRAEAGGVWVFTPTSGNALRGKVLGDEILCRIETPPNVTAVGVFELTADRSDLGCDIRLPEGEEMSHAATKVMEVFLKKAIVRQDSGHIVLSEATLRERDTNA